MPDLFGAVADHEPDHGPARLTSIRPTPVVMSTADKSSPRYVLPRDLSDALRQLDDCATMLTLAQAADMTGALAAYKLALAEERISELKRRLEEMRQERDRARAGEDAWKAQCEAVTRQIALPAPHDAQTAQQPPDTQPSRFRRDGRWMRATGCLVGAGLLLALSTVSAGAQQQQPQQQPPPGCFTVEMSHSTQGNPQGSILLDRCTGKTWLLLCIRNDTAGCAFRWAPIPDATEPAGGP